MIDWTISGHFLFDMFLRKWMIWDCDHEFIYLFNNFHLLYVCKKRDNLRYHDHSSKTSVISAHTKTTQQKSRWKKELWVTTVRGSDDLSLPAHFNILLSWLNVLVRVLWCVQPLTPVSSPGLFTEAVCGKGGRDDCWTLWHRKQDVEFCIYFKYTNYSRQLSLFSVSNSGYTLHSLFLSCTAFRTVFIWISVVMYVHTFFSN